jgi:predicted nuclease with TOPRIM domain
VDEMRTTLLPSLQSFNQSCQELLVQASEKFTPREHLIRYLEKILTEEESKVQGSDTKLIARDYDRLKEFAEKVKRHLEVEVSEYFIHKRAKELKAEVNLLIEYEETFRSLVYLRVLDLDMINEYYHSVLDQTAGNPLPDQISRDNIVDLYKLKVGKVKQLNSQLSTLRGSQEMMIECDPDCIARRLSSFELKFAQFSTLQGGLEGVSDLLADVHHIKIDLKNRVLTEIPSFIEKTQGVIDGLNEQNQLINENHRALKADYDELKDRYERDHQDSITKQQLLAQSI